MDEQLELAEPLEKRELLRMVEAFDRVLVVHGRDSFHVSGAADDLMPLLAREGTRSIATPGGDPCVEGVCRLLRELAGVEVDAILAVGGGSVMDTGKLLKAFWGAPHKVREGLGHPDKVRPGDAPMFALPTLVGSGSEVTHFAVIYDGPEKFSIADQRLRPRQFAYCSDYVRKAPLKPLAASALDALCQAIESYWSIHSTESSRKLAGEAVGVLMRCLRAAVLDRDIGAIGQLQRGVHLAGCAIDITKTTAPHAVSYALSSCHGVSHGHAVALLLPMFFAFNDSLTVEDCLDPRGVGFVRQRLTELRALLGVSGNRQVEDVFAKFLRSFGLHEELAGVGIRTTDDLARIVVHGFNPQRVNNNPRKLTKEHLHALLAAQLQLPASVAG